MNQGKFLIVEDEFVVAENLRTELISMGYEVVGVASSGKKAIELACREKPDLVMMDIQLRGEIDGIEAAIQLRRDLDVPVLFLTAFADESFLERAKLAEPLGYLVKPYERKALKASIETAHYKARVDRLLKESEMRFRSVFENSPLAYAALDESGYCLDFNSELCELLGYGREELIGKKFSEFWPPETHHLFLEQLAKHRDNGMLQMETELVRKDDTLVAVLLDGRIQRNMDGTFLRLHCILHNITERKRAEEERLQFERRMRQAEKAEGLARMAGAIAHRFNNMLGTVLGNLELALCDLPQGSEVRSYLVSAMQAGSRAADVSRFMLTYLGQTSAKKEQLDLTKVVEESHALLIPSIPANVKLLAKQPSARPIILADREHLLQILSNLVTNAAEAIGEKEGDITVAAEFVSAEKIAGANFFPLDWRPQGKGYACLAVADTGPGLDTSTIDKIFDPFFTTKFTGRGLGLPIILGLSRVCEGVVTVASNKGEGTVFRVCFPLSEQAESGPREEVCAPPRAPGGGFALVVDDELALRKMVQNMFERRMGYKVITAGNGFEAVEMFRKHKSEISLVLLDLTMPGMDGWQTLTALRELRPDIPVILASGYDEAQVMAGSHKEKPQAFLHKPYSISDLRTAVDAASRSR